jgi:hypothetical protein
MSAAGPPAQRSLALAAIGNGSFNALIDAFRGTFRRA